VKIKSLVLSVCNVWAVIFLFLPNQSEGGALSRKLRVTANCILRYTTVTNCVDIKNEFFQQQSNIIDRVDSSSNVDLEFTVTDEQIDATHIGYTYKWISHMPETSTEPFIPPPLVLSTGLDQLSTLTKLRDNASKCLAFYLDIVSEVAGDNNSTTVTYKLPNDDPASPEKPGWIERLANSPYYFNLRVSGSSATQGSKGNTTKQEGFPESLEVAYLKSKFKVDVTGSVSVSKMSLPNGTGGTLSGSDTQKNFSGLTVYSFTKDWSVAVVNTATIDPGANIRLQNTTQTGVEWILIPFRTTENHELAFRVGPQYTTLNLYTPNILNHVNENYLGVFAQVYLYWVTFRDKLMIGLSGTGTENIQHTNFYQATFAASATYQVNSIIGFTGQASYLIDPQSITFPGNPNYSNPLQSLFLSGQPGSTSNFSFSMNLTLGNSRWKKRDRRWNTSLTGN